MYITVFRNCPEGGMSFSQMPLDYVEGALVMLDDVPPVVAIINEHVDVQSYPAELRDGHDYGVYDIEDEAECDTHIVIATDEVDCAIRFYQHFMEKL